MNCIPQSLPAAAASRLTAAVFVWILATPALAIQTTMVSAGATWRYLDNGSNQGTAWSASGFDDSAWGSGPAQLGYGDGDESTLVSFGADSGNKFITTYFRHTFLVTGAASYTSLALQLLRDDGAIVYLNGTEVFRSNMPGGTVSFVTPASAAVGGTDESTFYNTAIDAALLAEGTNVIAVEIHQSSGTSSDISFDLELTASDAPFQLTRGPYLQLGTPSSVWIRWRTDTPTSSRVRYGLAPGALTQSATFATTTTDHRVQLTGLSPETTYFYAVGSSDFVVAGDDADHRFTTPPPAGIARPTRIWVLGDSGTANADARRVRDAFEAVAGAQPPDLWLMLGDNAYEDGTDAEYQAAVFDVYPAELRASVLWPTLGNHDGHSADSATQTGPYYDIFTLPVGGEAGGVPSATEAYYSFDHGNIHFVCLDSYDSDRSTGGPMLTWLENDLMATDAQWIVAFWHHPPYSKGSHDSDTETALVQMRQNALPILESYGVDLVLGGHSHSYERSVLLDSHYGVSTTLSSSMIIDSGDGRPGGDGAYQKGTAGTAHDGAVYVVAGSSGKVSSAALDHPAMYVSLPRLGSLVLDVDADVLDATFLDDGGAAADHFRMVKSALCGNGTRENGEPCDGADLGGAACGDTGCSGGSPTCTTACVVDYGSCTGCSACDDDGACEAGEDCNNCPNDCAALSGAACGNGICEAGNGEDCVSCPQDCNGRQSGKPSGRYCCGDGDGQNPLACTHPTCTAPGFQCTDAPASPSCCGDSLCNGAEDGFSCEIDCGAPPFCGDGSCAATEDSCSCAADCGPPPVEACADGADNDCDGQADCADSDCSGLPACSCSASGAACVDNSECCSNKCKGKPGSRTCG